MKRVERLPLEALSVGMVLAEAVLDDAGRLLIPAGSALTENTIASLARREISTVAVELAIIEDEAEREAYRRHACKELDQLFRHAGDGEETRMLYQTILAYRLEYRP